MNSQIPVLSLENLSVDRGRKRVIQGLNLQLGTGITALLGPNGAGKTTLLEAIVNPRLAHRSGSVSFCGTPLRRERDRRAYAARIGFMPQHWVPFPGFTAHETVAHTGWLKGVAADEAPSAASHAISAVGLTNSANAPVSKMSGGMRQRVGLAEAVVNAPELVILDEPTVGLDPEQRASFREHLRTAPTTVAPSPKRGGHSAAGDPAR